MHQSLPSATAGASATSTPTSTGAAAALTWGQALTLVVLVAVLVLVAGLVVLWARSTGGGHGGDVPSGASVVRSWIAVSLTVGILVLTAVSFALPDTSLRSTLVGALTASLGSAVAFYFASKASEQAQQNLLTASGDIVPDLVGRTETEVNAIVAKLALKVSPPPASLAAGQVVVHQVPVAGSKAGPTTTVVLTYG